MFCNPFGHPNFTKSSTLCLREVKRTVLTMLRSHKRTGRVTSLPRPRALLEVHNDHDYDYGSHSYWCCCYMSLLIRHPVRRTRCVMFFRQSFFSDFLLPFFIPSAPNLDKFGSSSGKFSWMAFIFVIVLPLVITHAESDFWCRASVRWIFVGKKCKKKKEKKNTARIQAKNPWPIPAIFH